MIVNQVIAFEKESVYNMGTNLSVMTVKMFDF